jgi:hypothetical protein
MNPPFVMYFLLSRGGKGKISVIEIMRWSAVKKALQE